MVLIPPGTFTMGSDQVTALDECEKYFAGCNREEWYLNEGPVHQVTLESYYIDVYELTNRQYQECVAAGACTPPSRMGSSTRSSYFEDPGFADYPVIWVSWEQAQTYCAWRGARLPTEAEWEKAARGTDARLYPWGDSFEAGEGNFCDTNCELHWANKDFDDGFADTAPVGSFPSGASPYGVQDMGGNVNEWVADWYDEQYYASSPSVNPMGPETGINHGIRGGSFHTPGQGLRTAARPLSEPAADYIGFRCAASAE
jgi:formylglycine-generating enzyme required for sulfatase activity